MNSEQTSERYNIRVLERGIQVLLAFVEKGPRLTADAAAQATRLPKSTTYRILATLQQHGLLVRNPQDDTYSLGSTAVLIGATAIREMDLPQKVRPYLEQLMQITGETVHLAMLTQQHVVVVDKIDSPHPLRLVSTIGFRSPLHCTGVGKVFLANLSQEVVERLLKDYSWRRYTPNTMTDPILFVEELRRIKAQGYALDQEEFNAGLRCVAAPLYDYTAAVVAAVSISGPSSRMTEAKSAELVQVLTEQTRRMSHELGCKG